MDKTKLHEIPLRLRPVTISSEMASGVRFVALPVNTLQKFQRQRNRILNSQRRWENIKSDLPPQLSRKHIGMISIGGVIGTGLFLGSADALRNGGPIGAFLGYWIVGSVVYCLCVSVGEMVAYLPNVGGVIGLADLYVDPALGFSLGWAAWVTAEVTAAAVVLGYWDTATRVPVAATSAFFLALATALNCFPSRIFTIVLIVLVALIIDLGASPEGRIGFRYWVAEPFAPTYLGIGGAKGHFLGLWAIIMQACFSFTGSEVPGIAAGEVIDATRNVPRALRKVWVRIALFYLGGILCAGLLVPASDPALLGDDRTGRHSPFVIAFSRAGYKVFPDVVNASILISAWSAAASDIYISSRFLFFLARQGHAPSFLAHLFRMKHARHSEEERGSESGATDVRDSQDSSEALNLNSDDDEEGSLGEESRENPNDHSERDEAHPSQMTYILPLASVLVSASVGLLTFLSSAAGSASGAFQWLMAVASVASLQSWAGMLYTYIRWHKGTTYVEKQCENMSEEEAASTRVQLDEIKKNRQWGQPYLAWYAFSLCMIVLLTNGWAVFVHNGWQIADIPGDVLPEYDSLQKQANPVSQFLSAYVPIPFFLLLTFGYKLINQTQMTTLDEMVFYRGKVPPVNPHEEEPKNRLERFLQWIRII